MLKNRFYKSTLGIHAEIVIAQSLDVTEGASAGTNSTGTASVTVAATTTAGDQVSLSVDGYTFVYTSASALSAANFGTALLAALNADAHFASRGIVWTKSGTTSLVLTGTAAGALINGAEVNFEAGAVNAGPSFSSFSATDFAGGTNVIIGFQSNHQQFVESAIAGALGVYWDDTLEAVQPGETGNPANRERKFFYAYKDANGVAKRCTAIPCSTRTYVQAPYTAGQADIYTVTYGDTISTGQTIHVKVIDATWPANVPSPFFTYQAKVTSTVTAAVASLAAQINAETQHDSIFTATASTNVLTITGVTTRNLKIAASLEVTVAQPTDASAIVIAQTQKAITPLGTLADIRELQNYATVAEGGSVYSGNPFVNVSELQDNSGFNSITGINFGHLIVRTIRHEKGETRNYEKKMVVIVAIPTASLAALATL